MSKWLVFACVALYSMMGSMIVAAQEQFVAGKHYVVIDTPVSTSDPTKIEVTEVFWYGCPHCNTFRPAFEQWKKTASG